MLLLAPERKRGRRSLRESRENHGEIMGFHEDFEGFHQFLEGFRRFSKGFEGLRAAGELADGLRGILDAVPQASQLHQTGPKPQARGARREGDHAHGSERSFSKDFVPKESFKNS